MIQEFVLVRQDEVRVRASQLACLQATAQDHHQVRVCHAGESAQILFGLVVGEAEDALVEEITRWQDPTRCGASLHKAYSAISNLPISHKTSIWTLTRLFGHRPLLTLMTELMDSQCYLVWVFGHWRFDKSRWLGFTRLLGNQFPT